MVRAALFCDETIDYRIPEEPDTGDVVTLRFRTAKDDADKVCLIVYEQQLKIELKKVESQGLFDFYECELPVGEAPLHYYFEISKGEDACRYNRLGVSEEMDPKRMFLITPGFHVPEWAKGAVMYQIFVDRFRNGDPANDVVSDEYVYIGFPVEKIDNWEEGLSVHDVDRFYGGDIQGIWDKLDYLQNLKVEVLYLSPVFVSPSNHKYDCQDYEHIDPHYGKIVKDADGLVDADALDNRDALKYSVRTADPENLKASDEFFAQFVEEVHKRGMKIILDGVFNHCGSFNKWLDREKIYEKNGGYEPGAYASADSPYRDFFLFKDDSAEAWPDNKSYEGWWNHNTLPKLNYEGSEKLYQYILDVAKKWLAPPYCIDGWRLDVAADLGHSSEMNHKFWRDFRKVVKETNPDSLILAEHYGDSSSWLKGDQWDTIMNYDAFMDPLSWFLTGLEKHSDRYDDHLCQNSQAFMYAMLDNMCSLQTPSLMAAMNELSNHDHSRFLTRTNREVGRLHTRGAEAADSNLNYGTFRAAAIVQMTWPGAPTIYYGDEAGVCGWTDPDSRRTYPWGKENQELIEFHLYLTGIRKRNKAFRNGSFKPLVAESGVIAYGRFHRGERGVVVVNSTGLVKRVHVPVWQAEVSGNTMTRIMKSTAERYNVGKVEYPVENGSIHVELAPYCAMIFEEKTLDF
ncbi:MAG: alpha-glycosidase [Lachnospiraceae bacterium]|nr:alpha-glycosidase [Lachnospiraceae bacterium]